MKFFWNHEDRWIFLNYMGKMVRAGAGAGISDKRKPEPHKNEPAPQHWFLYRAPVQYMYCLFTSSFLSMIAVQGNGSYTQF
jgi:hypothetical protein